MYSKDFIFYISILVKCISWQIFIEIVENQDYIETKLTNEKIFNEIFVRFLM